MRGRSWSASRIGSAWPIDGAALSAVSLPRRLFGICKKEVPKEAERWLVVPRLADGTKSP